MPFSQKIRRDQTRRRSGGSASMRTGSRHPEYSPAATTASTPEPPSCSAARKAAKGVMSESVISMSGSLACRRSSKVAAGARSP